MEILKFSSTATILAPMSANVEKTKVALTRPLIWFAIAIARAPPGILILDVSPPRICCQSNPFTMVPWSLIWKGQMWQLGGWPVQDLFKPLPRLCLEFVTRDSVIVWRFSIYRFKSKRAWNCRNLPKQSNVGDFWETHFLFHAQISQLSGEKAKSAARAFKVSKSLTLSSTCSSVIFDNTSALALKG